MTGEGAGRKYNDPGANYVQDALGLPIRGRTGDVKGLNRGGQTKLTQRSGNRTYDYKYREELRL